MCEDRLTRQDDKCRSIDKIQRGLVSTDTSTKIKEVQNSSLELRFEARNVRSLPTHESYTNKNIYSFFLLYKMICIEMILYIVYLWTVSEVELCR